MGFRGLRVEIWGSGFRFGLWDLEHWVLGLELQDFDRHAVVMKVGFWDVGNLQGRLKDLSTRSSLRVQSLARLPDRKVEVTFAQKVSGSSCPISQGNPMVLLIWNGLGSCRGPRSTSWQGLGTITRAYAPLGALLKALHHMRCYALVLLEFSDTRSVVKWFWGLMPGDPPVMVPSFCDAPATCTRYGPCILRWEGFWESFRLLFSRWGPRDRRPNSVSGILEACLATALARTSIIDNLLCLHM